MTDNMFDKFVRDKLESHQSTVPPGLWEKIERKKDKDPKGGFFLPGKALWAGLLIIAAGIGTWYYLSGNNEQQSTTQLTETAAANKSGTVAPSSNAGTGDDHTSQTITTQQDNTSNPNTGTDNHQNNDATSGGDNVEPGMGNDRPTHNAITTDNKTKPFNNTQANMGRFNNTTQKTTQNRSGRFAKNTAGKNTAGFTPPNPSIDKFDIVPTVNEVDDYRRRFSTGKTAYNLRGLAGFDNQQYNLSDFKIVGIDCPPNGRPRRNDWYLEVYASPDIVMKSVKANSNESYVSKKDSTESQQLSYTAGFRFSKSIGENLLVKTGLQYSQINERFDLRTENERRIITVVTIRTVTGSNGADSTISDTSTIEQIGYRLQRTYNRYRSIDIPLLLSYEFGNENLRFAVNAGAIVNLYSWYTGNTINDSLAVISMNSKTSGIYKHNIGVGLYGGFSIIKPISGKFDLFLEPYFRYNLSNMSRMAGYSQRFNAAGLNFGIRYKLKGQRNGIN